MPFRILLTHTARNQLDELGARERHDARKLKKVRNCLARLQANPRRQGLRTHEYRSLRSEQGEKVWEAYVENNAPAAWRIFWHYGPDPGTITIVAITPHP